MSTSKIRKMSARITSVFGSSVEKELIKWSFARAAEITNLIYMTVVMNPNSSKCYTYDDIVNAYLEDITDILQDIDEDIDYEEFYSILQRVTKYLAMHYYDDREPRLGEFYATVHNHIVSQYICDEDDDDDDDDEEEYEVPNSVQRVYDKTCQNVLGFVPDKAVCGMSMNTLNVPCVNNTEEYELRKYYAKWRTIGDIVAALVGDPNEVYNWTQSKPDVFYVLLRVLDNLFKTGIFTDKFSNTGKDKPNTTNE